MQSPRISPAEWEVMKVLWERSPRTANEVIDALPPSMNWHPKTVRTLLHRLTEKGALSTEKEGRAHAFSPAVQEKAVVREESRSFLDRVFDGGVAPMLAHFLDSENISEQEISELRRLLDEKAGKGEES
jgi:BlaI family transcriptional regulator, penicillinase repressor